MWPLYIAEIHGAAPAAAGNEIIGKPLPNNRRDSGVLINPASFEDYIFATAVGLDRAPASRLVEGLYGPVVNHDGLHRSAADWIGRRAAKRRKDGKKRGGTLKTVDADW